MSIALWFKKAKRPKSRLDTVLLVLKNFSSKRFSNVYLSKMSIITLHSHHPNILTYISMLEMFYHHLSNNEEVIYRSLIPNESTVLTLYTFFLDKNGYYVDTTTIGKEFIDVSIKYLTLYSQLMNHNEQTFANKKNLLFMEDVTNNLLNIIETMDVNL